MALNKTFLEEQKNILAKQLNGISEDKIKIINQMFEFIALVFYNEGLKEGKQNK